MQHELSRNPCPSGRGGSQETFILPGMERVDSLREVELAEAEISYLESLGLQEDGLSE